MGAAKRKYGSATVAEAAQRLFGAGAHPAQGVLERESLPYVPPTPSPLEEEDDGSAGPDDEELAYMFGEDSRGES